MLRRFWQRPLVRKFVYTVATIVVVLSVVCWYFGISSPSDVSAYVSMAAECHPVWKELALHRIREGQAVDEVIAATKPVCVVRRGRFVQLLFQKPLSYSGVEITALDGKLVHASAASCCWSFTFFDAMTDADYREKSASLDVNERRLEIVGQAVIRPPDIEQPVDSVP